MKKLLITMLMVGYLALVPFCLLGGSMMASAESMDMGSLSQAQMPMDGTSNCGVPSLYCAMSGNAMDTFMHHMEMYLSLTNALPSLALLLAVISLFVLIAFALKKIDLHFGAGINYFRNRKTVHRSHFPIHRSSLHWLSLLESSPNFA